jgi:hypothetical protein
LHEGQIATGWFNYSADGEMLVPSLGYRSFETETLPVIQRVQRGTEFRLVPGQVAYFSDIDLEIRLIEISVSPCAPGANCSSSAYQRMRFDLIHDGRHRTFELTDLASVLPDIDDHTIKIMDSDRQTYAVIRIDPPPINGSGDSSPN